MSAWPIIRFSCSQAFATLEAVASSLPTEDQRTRLFDLIAMIRVLIADAETFDRVAITVREGPVAK